METLPLELENIIYDYVAQLETKDRYDKCIEEMNNTVKYYYEYYTDEIHSYRVNTTTDESITYSFEYMFNSSNTIKYHSAYTNRLILSNIHYDEIYTEAQIYTEYDFEREILVSFMPIKFGIQVEF